MKQKGSVKAILAIIIALLIVGGGFYFVFYKKIITIRINSLESFTSSMGLFSIKYPTTWIPLRNVFNDSSGFMVEIPSGANSRVAFFVIQDIGGTGLDSLNIKPLIKTKELFGKIDGYSTNTYTSETRPGSKFYVINIEPYEKTPVSIIAGVYMNPKLDITDSKYSKILDEVERAVRSITINKNKTQILKTIIDSDRVKAENSVIKANLNNMRASAELYYDNNKDSYSGFCKSEYLKGVKEVESVTQTPLICRDSKEDYVISSALVDGGSWCVDSRGVSTDTKAMDTENSCVTEQNNKTYPPAPALPGNK